MRSIFNFKNMRLIFNLYVKVKYLIIDLNKMKIIFSFHIYFNVF